MQQSAVLTLPPLSVLLKEGLKGAIHKDSSGSSSFQCGGSAGFVVQTQQSREVLSVPLVKVKADEVLGRSLKNQADVTLFPRRKAGETNQEGSRGPVVLSVELLKSFYGMPLHLAAKKLGICQTAIKKVCRRLGIKKWPYKDTRVLVHPSSLVHRKDDMGPTPLFSLSSPINASEDRDDEVALVELVSQTSQTFVPTPPKREEEVVTAVHALLSLNTNAVDSSDAADAHRRVSYVDLIRINSSLAQ